MCDQCKPKYFNLVEDKSHKKGCLTCFCNGLSIDCKSSDFKYNQISANFKKEHEEWRVTNKFTHFEKDVLLQNDQIVFENFNEHESEELFFIVPKKFKGDKVY